jgi:hypothetical protein
MPGFSAGQKSRDGPLAKREQGRRGSDAAYRKGTPPGRALCRESDDAGQEKTRMYGTRDSLTREGCRIRNPFSAVLSPRPGLRRSRLSGGFGRCARRRRKATYSRWCGERARWARAGASIRVNVSLSTHGVAHVRNDHRKDDGPKAGCPNSLPGWPTALAESSRFVAVQIPAAPRVEPHSSLASRSSICTVSRASCAPAPRMSNTSPNAFHVPFQVSGCPVCGHGGGAPALRRAPS